MDLSLILLLVGFIVVIFLIFKFIKKIVIAIISTVVLVIVIIGAVFGLVYLDYNYLTSQQDYDVNIILEGEEDYILGVLIPVVNQSLEFDEITGINNEELEDLDVKDIKKDDGVFAVTVPEELFESIIVKDKYTLEDLNLGEEFSEYEISLTKDEILQVMNSEESVSELTTILLDKNYIEGLERTIGEPLIESLIETELSNMGLNVKQAIFMLVLSESIDNKDSVISLVKAFKANDLNVYPERFSFKFVRLLPVNTIADLISPEEIQE